MNIVTNFYIIQALKSKSKYFKVNLGFASTEIRDRTLSKKDRFSYFYNTRYLTTIYAQGEIGDIVFYTDHLIKDAVMAVYDANNEEYIIPYNEKIVNEKGVDFFLGSVLKQIEEEHTNRIKNNEIKKKVEEAKGNADILKTNPGAVTYDDIKAYIEQQNKNRI